MIKHLMKMCTNYVFNIASIGKEPSKMRCNTIFCRPKCESDDWYWRSGRVQLMVKEMTSVGEDRIGVQNDEQILEVTLATQMVNISEGNATNTTNGLGDTITE